MLLQVVHDLRWVTDDVVIMHQDRHLAGGIQTHEPGLVVFT